MTHWKYKNERQIIPLFLAWITGLIPIRRTRFGVENNAVHFEHVRLTHARDTHQWSFGFMREHWMGRERVEVQVIGMNEKAQRKGIR